MQSIALAALVFALVQQPTPPPAPAPADPKPVPEKVAKPPVYNEKADAQKDIAAALGRAAANNRRVMIQWGANWCGWCIKLHETSHKDAAIAKKLLYEYDVVHVDIGKWDKNLDLVEKYGADIKGKGVPYLTVLDAKGVVLANQETSSLEIDGNAHDPKKVLAFLTQHQAAYEKADELLAQALATAKESKRRVFLTFGAPWCGWCHKLEDWLATAPVAALMGKDFVIRKIDVDRTIGGKELKAKYGTEQGGIPWFCTLEADGTMIAGSNDAKGDNIGFPYKDEEITVFTQLLSRSARNLSLEDIDKLHRSLVDVREADLAKKAAR